MKISELKGIGEKTEKLFNRLEVYNTDDLLGFYPRTYDVYEEPVSVDRITDEKNYAIWGTVVTSCEMNVTSRYKVLSVFVADDEGNRIKMTWFNMPFLKNNLKRGYKYIFRGKVAFRGSLVFMEQPAIYSFEAYSEKMNSMQPVYSLTAGLTNNSVTKAVKQCFETGHDTVLFKEFLPKDILETNQLLSREKALFAIHFPKDFDELKKARQRIVFDEFFLFTLSIRSLKNTNLVTNNNFIVNHSEYSERILSNLGYELTNAQKKVYEEMVSDMSGNRIMNRLIQGDVGSGKTIVALLAMMDCCYAGYQSALMAPTEVLAAQHYEAFSEIIEKNNIPLKCVLLTGSLSAAVKRNTQACIATGEADIIIGTHAVITDKVEFNRLGLVVTDEQHRFGVHQREALHKKGMKPHVVVMSATPIPRSLAIILYGDLDISIIDEKPAMRLPIKNCVVDDSYHEKAYRFILDEINKGHQAYIICAMAKESDNSDLANVVEYTKELQKHYGPGISIKYLHGKMKPAEKNQIMNEFASGAINILVSTTVVEVGINVPNATVMMVENAERFGLAGLHQLRGRVGRGKAQSYCIFVSNSKNKLTKERLNILKESNDGFYISEQDLKLRGPGDMLGTRQSGDFDFALGDIYTDAATLKLASDTASWLLDKDRTLEDKENEMLKKQLEHYMMTKMDRINL